MTINARTLIEPSFILRGVNADYEHVRFGKIHKVGYVETKRNVTAQVLAQVMTIEHDHCITIHAVKLEADALPLIVSRERERSAVPANAGLRILAAERLGTLMMQHGSV